jgi:hypothetical protein
MKFLLFHSTAVAALSLMIFAASLQTTRADEVDDAVKGIRVAYNAIEAAKLREETVEFESEDDPVSGSCTRYFKGDELVKIRIIYTQGDHGGADENYYYTVGELFFAYVSESSWAFTGEENADGEGETMDTVREHRVYFANGSLLGHLAKEASAKDEQALKGLLAKAENKPFKDEEVTGRIYQFGNALPGAKTAAELISLLTE